MSTINSKTDGKPHPFVPLEIPEGTNCVRSFQDEQDARAENVPVGRKNACRNQASTAQQTFSENHQPLLPAITNTLHRGAVSIGHPNRSGESKRTYVVDLNLK